MYPAWEHACRSRAEAGPRAAAARAAADRVRALGRREPGRQPGRDAPRSSSAGSCPTWSWGPPRERSTARRSATRRTSPGSPSSRRCGSNCAPTASSPAARSTARGTSFAAAPTFRQRRPRGHHPRTASPARSFADLEIPLRVIATDLDTGEEVVLCGARSSRRCSPSAALPGVFPIVHHDGRRLVDGGVVNNVPLSHALAGPVDRVFVLNVSSGMSDADRTLAARRRDDELHPRAASASSSSCATCPRTSRSSCSPARPITRDLFDFSGARELIDEAYDLAYECARPRPRVHHE